jgi:uncharacterized OB-fold protein
VIEQSALRLGPWTTRPLERIAPELVPFWDGLREHEFRLCLCTVCGAAYWPYTLCPLHDDFLEFSDMEWRASSGRGTVYANLTVHRVTDQTYAAELPYSLALIELTEGPLFPTRLVGSDPADVAIGAAAEISYFDVEETGVTWPLFALTGSAEGTS